MILPAEATKKRAITYFILDAWISLFGKVNQLSPIGSK